MLIHVRKVLSRDEVSYVRGVIEAARWESGPPRWSEFGTCEEKRAVAARSKASRRLGERVLGALLASPAFISAAIPLRIFPPLFNRYGVGDHFDMHVDNAVRGDPLTGARIRVDLAATLFLSDPDEYEGGELVMRMCTAHASLSSRRATSRSTRPGARAGDANHARRSSRILSLAAKRDPP